MDDYLKALNWEIVKTAVPHLKTDTVYLGGGTPSLLAPAAVSDILASVRVAVDLDPTAEITLEANPGSVDLAQLAAFRRAGINRLSIGIQSFQDTALQWLGRTHSSDQGFRAVEEARKAGVDNLALDLIYGLPEQSEASWLKDLQQAVNLAPDHLSCYLLSYEKGTALDRRRREGRVMPLPENDSAALFRATHEVLGAAGYRHYEISNFARSGPEFPEGRRSRHNSKYWSGGPYRGFGPSAHSYDGRRQRWWNVGPVELYIHLLCRENRLPMEGRETLTDRQQIIEHLFLALRTREGINVGRFEVLFEIPFEGTFEPALYNLEHRGLLVRETGRFRPTLEGMLMADTAAAMLINCL